jgi:predicted membrane-bound spermidine synthase
VATIVVSVRKSGGYIDGDVIEAFNDARILGVFPDAQAWQASDQELFSYLVLTTDDFSDAAMERLNNREFRVDWRSHLQRLGVTEAQVQDARRRKDVRHIQFTRQQIVQAIR